MVVTDTFGDKNDCPGHLVGQLGLLTIILIVIVSVCLCLCAYLPPLCAGIMCD